MRRTEAEATSGLKPVQMERRRAEQPVRRRRQRGLHQEAGKGGSSQTRCPSARWAIERLSKLHLRGLQLLPEPELVGSRYHEIASVLRKIPSGAYLKGEEH
jgi:hypothetical protein